MIPTISKNAAAITGIVIAIFGLFDIELEFDTVNQAIAAVLLLASLALAAWNQITRPDVKKFFFKK